MSVYDILNININAAISCVIVFTICEVRSNFLGIFMLLFLNLLAYVLAGSTEDSCIIIGFCLQPIIAAGFFCHRKFAWQKIVPMLGLLIINEVIISTVAAIPFYFSMVHFTDIVSYFIAISVKSIAAAIIFFVMRKTHILMLFEDKRLCVLFSMLSGGVIVMYLMINLPKNHYNQMYYTLLYSILMVAIVFGLFWLYDRWFIYREHRVLENDNRQLSARLHRSKEMLPAMAALLSDENVQRD